MKTPKLAKPLQLYIVLTAALGGAWLGYLLSAEVAWDLSTLGKMGLIALLTVIAGIFPIPLAPKIKTDVTTAILFAGILLLDPGAVALAGVVGVTLYTYLKLRLPWYKYPFNAGLLAAYLGLAAITFDALVVGDSLLTVAIVPAAAIMYVVNTVLVAGAVSLQLKANPLRVWWDGTRGNGPAELGLMAFGFLGALAYEQSPWTILAMVIPVAVIYLAFSRLARANEKLEEAMHRLEALQGQIANTAKLASIGALSVDIAHQIKNPLAIVMGRLETLRDHLEAEGNRHLRHANIALEATERILELTESFTFMGQRQMVEMDLKEVISQAFGMAGLYKRRRVETRWEYADELPKVAGNPALVREALSNIFTNAMDAVEDGGVITTDVRRVNGTVTIRISDDGCGIPKEIKERLFEPFNTTKAKGSGLGLFTAKHILEMHKGEVSVESEEGKGTRVTVTLPAVESLNGHRSHHHRGGSDTPIPARSG